MTFKKLLILVAVLVGSALPACAAAFVVNSIADTPDALRGNGICADSSGDCTLRAAIEEANNFTGRDTITFAPALHGQTIVLTQGTFIVVNSAIEINGPGAKLLTIDAGTGTNRIFFVNYGSDLKIARVKLEDGNGVGPDGQNHGGAIFSIGAQLELDGVWLTNSTAALFGGGLYLTAGSLIVRNSTISGNSAFNGGGVYVVDSNAVFVNSTISSNSVSSSSLNPTGGGLAVYDSVATIYSSTIAFNFAFALDAQASRGGGISVVTSFASGTTSRLILANSIVSGNSSSFQRDFYVVASQVTSQGHNLINDSNALSATNWHSTDLLGRQPGTTTISPADNGGQTPTLALQPTSLARDGGTSLFAFDPVNGELLLTDQRGMSRNDLSLIDIGAYEYSNAPTAALVSISGRVVDSTGNGLAGIRVTLTDSAGNVRTARSNPFGFFRFGDVESGQSVVISAFGKGREFSPVVFAVSDDIADLLITANG